MTKIKVTEETVSELKKLRSAGMTMNQCGRYLGISGFTMALIAKSGYDLEAYRELVNGKTIELREKRAETASSDKTAAEPKKAEGLVQVDDSTEVLNRILLVLQNTHTVLLEIRDNTEKRRFF